MDIKSTRDGCDVRMTVAGRLTTDEADGFLKEIEPLMNESGLKIVMDLAGLEFISIAGIRCFILLLMSCNAKGSSLVLKTGPGALQARIPLASDR